MIRTITAKIMSYFVNSSSLEDELNAKVTVDDKLLESEKIFEYNSRQLTDEITKLRLKLDSIHRAQDTSLNALKQQQERDVMPKYMIQNFRMDSRKFLTSIQQNTIIQTKFTNLQQENLLLRQSLAQLETEIKKLGNENLVIQQGQSQRIQQFMLTPRVQFQTAISLTNLKNQQEYFEKQARIKLLDDLIFKLNQETAWLSSELSRSYQYNVSNKINLQTDLQKIKQDIENYNMSIRILQDNNQNVNRKFRDISQTRNQLKRELSQVKQKNVVLKPKAEKLEGLVYGRGLSPMIVSRKCVKSKRSYSRMSAQRKVRK